MNKIIKFMTKRNCCRENYKKLYIWTFNWLKSYNTEIIKWNLKNCKLDKKCCLKFQKSNSFWYNYFYNHLYNQNEKIKLNIIYTVSSLEALLHAQRDFPDE